MLLLIFAFLGCKEVNMIDPPIDTSAIIPLKVGNTWTYQFTMYDSLGSVWASFPESTSILSDTLINGRKVFLFSSLDYFWNEESGFWTQTSGKQPLLVYKYPANVGESYGLLITVICKDSTINTPKGIFNCYGYSSGIANSFVAPEIGVVKREYFQNRADGTAYLFQKEELINYSLN
jgi:hypothetical protein